MLRHYRSLVWSAGCLMLLAVVDRQSFAQRPDRGWFAPLAPPLDSRRWDDRSRDRDGGYERDYHYRAPVAPRLTPDWNSNDRRHDHRDYGRWDYRDHAGRPGDFGPPFRRDSGYRSGIPWEERRGPYDRGRVAALAADVYRHMVRFAREVDFDAEHSASLRRLHQQFRYVGLIAKDLHERSRVASPGEMLELQHRFEEGWANLTSQLWGLRWAVEGDWRGIAEDIDRANARLSAELHGVRRR